MKNMVVCACMMMFAMLVLSAGFARAAETEGLRLSKTCAGCHGTLGAAPGEYTPIIGGQESASFEYAMKAYRDDVRTDAPIMNAIAKAYDDEAVSALGRFFSSQAWMPSENGYDESMVDAGALLAEENGCGGCHGEMGVGYESFPRIGGQQPGYLLETLKRYKSGERTSDEMSFVADLTDNALAALAAYYTSLRQEG